MLRFLFQPAKSYKMLSALIGLSALLFVPYAGFTNYFLRIITYIFMYMIISQGWNILGGFGGYISFGNAVFFGVGAYGVAILATVFHLPIWLSLGIGILTAVPLAILMMPVLKLHGHYFAIGTWAVAEAAKELTMNLDISSGATGISIPVMEGGMEFYARFFYFLMLIMAIVTTIITYYIRRSPIGFSLIAMKSDDSGARAVGIDTARLKQIALIISALFASLAGSVYAFWTAIVEPIGVFNIHISILMVTVVLLGGIGTFVGPIIGAVLFGVLNETVLNYFLNTHDIVLGIILIAFVLYVPNGCYEIFKTFWRKAIPNKKREVSVL